MIGSKTTLSRFQLIAGAATTFALGRFTKTDTTYPSTTPDYKKLTDREAYKFQNKFPLDRATHNHLSEHYNNIPNVKEIDTLDYMSKSAKITEKNVESGEVNVVKSLIALGIPFEVHTLMAINTVELEKLSNLIKDQTNNTRSDNSDELVASLKAKQEEHQELSEILSYLYLRQQLSLKH
jgi:hypothetical protein